MLPALLSEAVLWAPPLLSHASKRENEQCRKQKRHEFLHLNYSFCFLRNTAKHAGNFSENGEIYTYTLYI